MLRGQIFVLGEQGEENLLVGKVFDLLGYFEAGLVDVAEEVVVFACELLDVGELDLGAVLEKEENVGVLGAAEDGEDFRLVLLEDGAFVLEEDLHVLEEVDLEGHRKLQLVEQLGEFLDGLVDDFDVQQQGAVVPEELDQEQGSVGLLVVLDVLQEVIQVVFEELLVGWVLVGEHLQEPVGELDEGLRFGGNLLLVLVEGEVVLDELQNDFVEGQVPEQLLNVGVDPIGIEEEQVSVDWLLLDLLEVFGEVDEQTDLLLLLSDLGFDDDLLNEVGDDFDALVGGVPVLLLLGGPLVVALLSVEPVLRLVNALGQPVEHPLDQLVPLDHLLLVDQLDPLYQIQHLPFLRIKLVQQPETLIQQILALIKDQVQEHEPHVPVLLALEMHFLLAHNRLQPLLSQLLFLLELLDRRQLVVRVLLSVGDWRLQLVSPRPQELLRFLWDVHD